MISKAWRRLLHAVRHRRAERELREEMEFHLASKRHELETAGLDSATAHVEARLAMGNRLLAQDHARDVWMWPWLRGLSLDFTLGVRMLVRYPGLTVVGGAAMAFGIAAGVGGFEIRTQFVDPALPLDEGRSIVGLRIWEVRLDRPAAARAEDFHAWRDQLHTIADLSAVLLADRNLIVDGASEPISVAEITASGFHVARVPPLLGRALVDADEAPDAPAVAVIGHSLWQRRFLADPHLLGRSIRLGAEQTTIVGVMPEGFGFPIAHGMWIPLRREAIARATAVGRPLLVFGRLAANVTVHQANAEFTTVGLRTALDAPETQRFLQPQVVPYVALMFDARGYGPGLALANIFMLLLLVLVSANVALLMYARAATRESEIAVRNAIGATRGRIVAQLLVESLVLSGVSVGVGLAAARFGLQSFWRMYEADSGRPLAFWLGDSLTPSTIAYAAGLTILGATIIGILPALNVTRRSQQLKLRQSTPGGGGFRFGGVWTAVIAAQVAVTVLFPASAFFFHRWVIEGQSRDVGFPAEEYLSARLVMDPATPPGAVAPTSSDRSVRAAAATEALRSRLAAEPGVTAVTFTDTLPGTLHADEQYEVEGDEAPPTYGHAVRVASIDADFFHALGARLVSGRGFTPSDFESERHVGIVNASFVARVMRGRNAVGRRIRLAAVDGDRPPGAWVEIVGVVSNLGMIGTDGAGFYQPLPSGRSSVHVAVHARGAIDLLLTRVRAVANEVDPTMRVYDLMPLNQVGAYLWLESQYLSRLLIVLSGIALLLSLTAIYSVMTFTVAQRTREIGVRMALGADRGRIVAAIVRQPLVQIGLGIGAGGVLVGLFFLALFQSTPTFLESGFIAGYAVLMLGICLLACVVPTRRALRLQPSEVLRSDG
jgi:putative ABC transport system permease protein